MANDSVGVAAASSPTNYIDNESISTGGSPATVDRQRVRVGGAAYTDLSDVVTGDTGQGAQVVVGARHEVSISSGSNVALVSTDCANFPFVTVYLSAKATGATVSVQVSNDNTNWVGYQLSQVGSSQVSSGASVLSSGLLYAGPVPARYFRLNQTGASSGTTTGTVEFLAAALWNPLQSVTVQNTSGVAVASTFAAADALSNGSAFHVEQEGFNGASWDRLRVPTKVFTATATASGDTALWTPTSGKKFRLMRYMIEVTSNAAKASGGLIEIVLRDSTTALGVGHSFFAPSAASTTFQPGDDTGWVDLGNGILSAAANNVLNINLSAALSSGEARVICAGTEE